ncbi:MAG: LysR family transcriptional regulator [Lachnospiraceae bacterium]|nr:LysR family transcriptional regulator [Lachnospiraceae bacterium]
MYNKQLDTFIKVAELGSFSKAAEAMYITPSAVIQQMNHLEKELQIPLLQRTNHGTKLTKAGEILLRKSREMVHLDGEIRQQMAALREQDKKEILVGTSLLHKCRLLYEMWMRFGGEARGYRVRLIDMSSDAKLYSTVDIVEGIQDGEPWQRTRNFLGVCPTPVVCAVPRGHRLAEKKMLTYEDMRGETLVTIVQGMSKELDHLRMEASEHGVIVVDVRQYDMSVFSMCIMNGYLLQTPACWQDIHPDMVTIPCEWGYSHPYGFHYQQEPSGPVQDFLEFVDELCSQEKFHV